MKHNLNLGCGYDLKYGWTNVDVFNLGTHIPNYVQHDLNKFPYPLKDNFYDNILIANVLEHLIDPTRVLKEVIRVSKRGGIITVVVPHASSYASNTDIQHRIKFTEHSFTPELLREYQLTQLSVKRQYFSYNNKWKAYIPFKGFFKIFLNGIYDDIIFKFEVRK